MFSPEPTADQASSVPLRLTPSSGAMTTVSKRSALVLTHPGVLLVVFLLTLPLVNPWVRGDGVGYYAYLHSLLIDHDLNFENEWRNANPSFVMGVLDANGR